MQISFLQLLKYIIRILEDVARFPFTFAAVKIQVLDLL